MIPQNMSMYLILHGLYARLSNLPISSPDEGWQPVQWLVHRSDLIQGTDYIATPI